ncbi:MAG TPA: response regulator [Ktedonobacteraceae bacterium]|nr:response regulator [Ktedonobacteraceae bacterium]
MREFETSKIILFVGSDELNAVLLMQQISHERPYRVFYASDSSAALKFTQYFRPNLFILDHCLPEINGIEQYDRLHRRKGLEHVPALLMGKLPLPYPAMVQRKIVGVCKPIDLQELLQKIDMLLRGSSPL